MLVDRYKYLDLFPCTPLELKIMGYVVGLNFWFFFHHFFNVMLFEIIPHWKQVQVLSQNNFTIFVKIFHVIRDDLILFL